MRLPDPIANTTTEAYLAYKAGVLKESDLQPKLRHPTNHFDAWLAYWTGLTNDYPKNEKGEPECLFDEEALVAFLAGVTTTYPEEIKDPYDVRIVGYLKYLVSARFKQPEETFNNEELYLSMMKTATVENDTPGSSLTLNNTLKAPFESVDICGNLTQDKYTGKNITSPLYFSGLFGTHTNTETGYIVKKGNTDKTVIGVYSLNHSQYGKIWNNIVSQTDLVLSFSVRSLTNQKLNFSYRLEPLPYNNIQLTTSWQKVVYKVQKSDARNFAAFIFYASNLDMTDPNCGFEIKDVQIEAGTEATNYEPFVGSVLPNGYSNLFDEFSNLPLSRNGITLSNQNGVLKLTGQPTADWVPLISRNITSFLQDKRTYTVFQPNIYGSKLYPEVIAQRKDGGKSMSWNGQNAKTFTFTVDFDTYSSYSMKLQMGPKTSYPEPITFYNNYALFVGNYNENNLPEYSPYNTPLVSPRPQLPQAVKELSGGKIQIFNKNLLNIRNNNGGLYSLKTTVNPDSSITIQGENKKFWGTNFTDDGACPRIEAGTKVTMSIDRPLPYELALSCWTSTGGPLFQFPLVIINAGSTSATSVAANTALSGHLYVSISEIGKQINETFKVQLEYGDTATDFVPHESSNLTIPNNLNIYKLTDTVYDEIKLENGVAKMIKRVGKLELSGEEYFRTINAENPGQFYVYSNVFDTLMKNSKACICSHFDIVPNTILAGVKTNKTILSVFSDSNSDLIRIMFSALDALNLKITDVASFKNWLKAEKAKGTPVTVYCEMKNQTEEAITDQAVLSALNAIKESGSYDGMTRIIATGTGDNPPALVKFSALKFR